MTTAPKEPKAKLKKYPYRGMGVNENAAVRVVWMVQPMCSIPATEYLKKPDGSYESNPAYTGEVNCQSGKWRDKWWEECEALGHHPYEYDVDRFVDIVEYDDEGVETSRKRKRIRRTGLNMTQVSHSIRHDSGRNVAQSVAKGYKFLPELGYENLCMMRSCETPAKIKTRYGIFCNERHARLVGADVEQIFLIEGGDQASQHARKKAAQLQEIQLETEVYKQ
jgi:hypothetical protein